MASNLSIRGLPSAVLGRLRERAASHRRSVNSEVIAILESAVTHEPPEAAEAQVAPAVREQAAAYAPTPSPVETLDHTLLADVCRRHSISWLAVFGSFARGEAGPDSDVDVVVEFQPGRTPGWGIVRVAEALRPVFGGRRVDLVTVRELGRLNATVMESARTLHGAR